jgi:hypothetical protein
MILALAAASLIFSILIDVRRDAGTLRLTKIQTDAVYMIMILSVILITVQVSLILV